MRIASKNYGLEWFPDFIYIIYYLSSGDFIFQILPLRRHIKIFIFIHPCRHYQDKYILHMKITLCTPYVELSIALERGKKLNTEVGDLINDQA